MFGAEPKFQGNFWASCDSVDLKLCLAKFSGPSPRGTRARGFSLGKKKTEPRHHRNLAGQVLDPTPCK